MAFTDEATVVGSTAAGITDVAITGDVALMAEVAALEDVAVLTAADSGVVAVVSTAEAGSVMAVGSAEARTVGPAGFMAVEAGFTVEVVAVPTVAVGPMVAEDTAVGTGKTSHLKH